MKRLFSVLFGAGLVLVGLLGVLSASLLPALGIQIHVPWWEVWRLWPLAIIGLGLFLTLLGMYSLSKREMGALFIPSVPILALGAILLYTSVFDAWVFWSFAWTLLILSVALGFTLAALFSRQVWFGIPAVIIGLNGAALAFTSLTGWWNAWSVLWTIEPLAIGITLLLVFAGTRSLPVLVVGLAFCGLALFSFLGMLGILLLGPWLLRLAGPAILILAGASLLLVSFLRRPVRQMA